MFLLFLCLALLVILCLALLIIFILKRLFRQRWQRFWQRFILAAFGSVAILAQDDATSIG